MITLHSNYPFGKYKKTKYLLMFGKDISYYFVTTIHTEEKCLEIMIDKAKSLSREGKKFYKIIKETEVEKKTIYNGKIENTK
jgi:hypothetical protein